MSQTVKSIALKYTGTLPNRHTSLSCPNPLCSGHGNPCNHNVNVSVRRPAQHIECDNSYWQTDIEISFVVTSYKSALGFIRCVL